MKSSVWLWMRYGMSRADRQSRRRQQAIGSGRDAVLLSQTATVEQFTSIKAGDRPGTWSRLARLPDWKRP